MNMILLVISSSFVILWGIAHLIPTKSIVNDFGDISEDNKLIITMEWINEGLTLIFIGGVILVTTFFGKNDVNLSQIINIAASIMLIGMAILSIFTGFKVKFIPFKLCPLIFILSAVLIILGTYL